MEGRSKNNTFKGIGAFLYREFYISLYNRAVATVPGDQSITENYINLLKKYITCVRDEIKCYKVFLESLFKFSEEKITYTMYLDKLTSNFFPSSMDHLFTRDHKDEILSHVIIDLIYKVGTFISKPSNLKLIIDDRKSNSRVVENLIITETTNILEFKKLEYANKFISKISKNPGGENEFLRQSNERMYKENESLKREIHHFQKLEEELKNVAVREEKYKRLIFVLHAKVVNLQAQLDLLQPVYTETSNGNSLLHIPSQDETLTRRNVENIKTEKKLDIISNFITTSPEPSVEDRIIEKEIPAVADSDDGSVEGKLIKNMPTDDFPELELNVDELSDDI
jgi:hypothetical protein